MLLRFHAASLVAIAPGKLPRSVAALFAAALGAAAHESPLAACAKPLHPVLFALSAVAALLVAVAVAVAAAAAVAAAVAAKIVVAAVVVVAVVVVAEKAAAVVAHVGLPQFDVGLS